MKVLPGKTNLNWSEYKSYEDILFHKSDEGIAVSYTHLTLPTIDPV